jgi:hypothetical protein
MPEVRSLRVSESDSFIHEVSEEVRRERFSQFLRRYGWLIALVVLAIVGGAALNEWRKARNNAAAEAAGEALRAALVIEDPADRALALGSLGEGQGGPVARIAEAGALNATGDTAGAGTVLAAVASDPEAPSPLRALASLQRVMVLGSEMPASERLATLEGLAADGAPFRPLALEQRALAHVDSGDTDAALADLEAIRALADAPEALRGRVEQLIVALGGAGRPADSGAAQARDATDG